MKGNVMKRLMLWFLLAVLFLPAAPSWAADGDLDTTFGTNGKVTTDIRSYNSARALAIQSDGKIVVAGEVSIGGDDFAVVRYNTDGSLDSTFGIDNSGIALTDFGVNNDYAAAIAIQNNSKIVVGGSSGGDFAVVRHNGDGSLDTTFGAGGGVITLC